MAKKILLFVMVMLLSVAVVACAPREDAAEETAEVAVEDAEPIRVAMIFEYVITDAGWNAAGYEGLMSAAEQIDNIEVAYSESIKSPEWVATARDYANQGFDMVFLHHGWMSDTALEVAPEFPDTLFVVSNSGITGPNYVGLDTKNEESGYIGGFVAGTVTQTKKIGLVMPWEGVLPFRRGILGFEKGLERACPGCEYSVTYVGSSDDIAGGKEAALAMYDAGVDVIWQYADATGLGVIDAAEETGQMVIGSGADQLELGPNSVVTTTIQAMGPVIFDVIQGTLDGTFDPNVSHLYGYDNGAYTLGKLNKDLLSEEQIAAILAVRDQLVNGEIEIEHIAE